MEVYKVETYIVKSTFLYLHRADYSDQEIRVACTCILLDTPIICIGNYNHKTHLIVPDV